MKVGIIGTGLIGGSLAYALKDKYEVFCFNRNTAVSERAVNKGAVDNYFLTPQELTDKSDIVVLASPLSTYKEISLKISNRLKNKIFTDIGSVKLRPSLDIFEILEKKENFVPAHPIAGRETSGFDFADGKLFIGKNLIITPFQETKEEYINVVSEMWKVAGSRIEFLTPAIHDDIYASVSHFVQMISFASKDFINASELTKEFCRLQNSPPAIWDEIFLYNKENIIKNFVNFKNSFEVLKHSKQELVNSVSMISSNDFSAYIISNLILNNTKEEYKNYAGSGFKSLTFLASKFNSLKASSKVVEESFLTIENIINEIKNSYLPGHV